MRYLKKTFEYLFLLDRSKRFFTIFLFLLPVGAVFSWLMPSGNYIKMISTYTAEPKQFFSIWTFDSNLLNYLFVLLITFVILIFCVSIIISIISRSFRVGVFKFYKPLTDFNDNFYPVFCSAVTYLVILILYKLVITTLLGLWKTIDDYYISLGMAVTTISIMTFISAILTAYTVLIMPIMSVTGVKLKYAFSQSIRKTSDMIIPIFLGLWIPVIAKSLIGSAIAVIGLKHLLLCMDILLNTCLFSYLVVYIMIVYYEIEQIKREDYTPHYYVKKSRKGISKD